MTNRRTYYQLILDRSGSMSVCMEQTVSGVNQQIRRIRELAARFPNQELFTSLSLFNTRLTPTWNRIRPEDLKELAYTDYRPDGGTALLDAVGNTLNDLQKAIGAEVERNEASVVVVIITDGYENSSMMYTHRQVSSLIRDLELSGKWSFSYLGATFDAVDIAVSLNIRRENSMSFSLLEIDDVNCRISNNLDDYIAEKECGNIKGNFLDEEERK